MRNSNTLCGQPGFSGQFGLYLLLSCWHNIMRSNSREFSERSCVLRRYLTDRRVYPTLRLRLWSYKKFGVLNSALLTLFTPGHFFLVCLIYFFVIVNVCLASSLYRNDHHVCTVQNKPSCGRLKNPVKCKTALAGWSQPRVKTHNKLTRRKALASSTINGVRTVWASRALFQGIDNYISQKITRMGVASQARAAIWRS